MKFTRFALLAFVATIGLAACEGDDPTESGAGEPFLISTDVAQRTVTANTAFTIRAYTVDQNNRRIPGELTATSAAPSVVSVDSVRYVQELSETRVFVKGLAVSAAPGTDINIAGHGLTYTTKVIVN